MNRLFRFLRDSAWTWGGAIIVLITLSGATQAVALWITGAAFVAHLLGEMFSGE